MAMAGIWDEAEFEVIFREHFERMVRITRRVLHSDAEAEEVCSETFLKLFRIGPGVQAGGTVGAWLYRVATRASIDRLRQSRRRGVEEEADPERSGVTNDLQDPLNQLIRNERIAEVRSTLARLKPEKAQLLLLRHSGLSYQEIAAAMQMKASSVGTMLARAEAEFSAQYQRHQVLNKGAMRVQIANHPTPSKEGR
jgi:RNA polymerase sigma-70 factor (ECF subfamily)